MMIRIIILCLALMLPISGRADVPRVILGPEQSTETIRIVGDADIPQFTPVLEAFAERNPGLRIEYESPTTADIFANAIVDCTTGAPGPHAILSSSVHKLVDLVNRNCAQRYRSAITQRLPDSLRWRDEVWGFSREPVVFAYNTEYFSESTVPNTRLELLEKLDGPAALTAKDIVTHNMPIVELSYLLVMLDLNQTSTLASLIEAFGAGSATLLGSTAAMLDGVAEGRFKLAYNALGSYAAARAAQDPRIGILEPKDFTTVLSRSVIVPKSAPSRALGTRFVDFLLSDDGQRVLTEQSFRNRPIAFDQDDNEVVATADRLVALSPALILANDAQKRAHLLALWNAAFRHRNTYPDM